MPTLLVMRWFDVGAGDPSDVDQSGYGDLDVIEVLDADQDPGTLVSDNTWGQFAFAYITDVDVDDQRMQDLKLPEFGVAVGDNPAPLLTKRLRYINRAQAPGDATQFLEYIPWGGDGSLVPADRKFTYAQLTAQLGERNTTAQELMDRRSRKQTRRGTFEGSSWPRGQRRRRSRSRGRGRGRGG